MSNLSVVLDLKFLNADANKIAGASNPHLVTMSRVLPANTHPAAAASRSVKTLAIGTAIGETASGVVYDVPTSATFRP
jgi:hypothetical protein